MPGQPNRKPGIKGRFLAPGVRSEVGDDWEPTVDPEELNRRLERRRRQVVKLKQDRSDLKAAMRLKTEEAYNEGLLSVAPALLEIDKKLAEITQRLLEGDLEGDDLKLLKTLLPELSKQRDRLYGKTRQRLESSSVSASVDVNELLRQRQGGVLEAGSGDVVDAEVVEGPDDGD